MIERPERAMVVFAHPDDEIGCSGTVATWTKEGTQALFVLCTNGDKGTEDPEMTSERLAQVREQEQREAARELGVQEVVFLGYPDAYLQPTLDVRRDITREIRRHQPDILITTNPTRLLTGTGYIGHPDHFAAGEAALSAVFPAARDHLTFPELLEEGLEPHKVREVLITGHDQPDKWIDVTDSMETAVEALLAHTSQLGQEAADRVREWKREAGKEHGAEYAEAFKSFILR